MNRKRQIMRYQELLNNQQTTQVEILKQKRKLIDVGLSDTGAAIDKVKNLIDVQRSIPVPDDVLVSTYRLLTDLEDQFFSLLWNFNQISEQLEMHGEYN